jgi:hypothetical protein
MAKIRIRYSTRHHPVSWRIRFESGPEVDLSHAEYAHPDGRVFGARMIGGVRYRWPSPKDRHVRYSEIEVNCSEAEFFRYLETTYAGSGYDFSWLLGWKYRLRLESPGRWVCSELVHHAARAKGCLLTNFERWISVRDLYGSVNQTWIN